MALPIYHSLPCRCLVSQWTQSHVDHICIFCVHTWNTSLLCCRMAHFYFPDLCRMVSVPALPLASSFILNECFNIWQGVYDWPWPGSGCMGYILTIYNGHWSLTTHTDRIFFTILSEWKKVFINLLVGPPNMFYHCYEPIHCCKKWLGTQIFQICGYERKRSMCNYEIMTNKCVDNGM